MAMHQHIHNHNHDAAVMTPPSIGDTSNSPVHHSMMTSSASSMSMTFSSWSDYKVSIVFQSITTSTVTEFVLSWFVIVLLVIAYHALRYIVSWIEEKIKEVNTRLLSAASNSEEEEPLTGSVNKKHHNHHNDNGNHVANNNNTMSSILPDHHHHSPVLPIAAISKRGLQLAKFEKLKWRIVHALVSATLYALALLLMLVAMTYNPWLFVALVVGYGIGDFLFFANDHLGNFSRNNSMSREDCH